MIYVYIAEGSEEIEFVTIVDLLRRVDIEVTSVSITDDKKVRGAHGITIEADSTFDETDYNNCDMIVLPGGMPGTKNMAEHEGLTKAIREFNKKGKLLGAICAAPLVFARSGILSEKRATIYPGMGSCLGDAYIMDDDVVQDGNIITSKGPGTAMDFALKIIEEIKGANVAKELRRELVMK